MTAPTTALPFHSWLIVFLLPLLSCSAAMVAATTTVPQPDPSLVAQWEGDVAIERYRIWADLNADGQPDMLLSEPIQSFGNAGGGFAVLLADNGGYREIGRIFAHPFAIALEYGDRYCGGHKIWWYARSNASSGMLGYNAILDGKLHEAQSIGITLTPDGNSLGNRLYEAIFTEPRLLKPEISTTMGDCVIWKPLAD